ncbi:thrombospondin type 3 repeat-containing protein [Chloroflexota bacterium]
MLLLVPVMVNAIDSVNRTDYYNDGTNYITDNIEDAGLEKGITGNLISENDITSSHGWSVHDGDPGTYRSGESYKGDLAIDISGYNRIQYDFVNNATFTGKVDMWVWVSEVGGSGWTDIGLWDNSDSAHTLQFNSGSGASWTCGAVACDTPVAIVFNTWNHFIWNFTGSEIETWIGDTLTNTETATGVSSINLYGNAGQGRVVLIDDIAMYNGDRPILDFDEDGILDPDDNCPYIPNPEQNNTDSDDLGDVCDTCPDTSGTFCNGCPEPTCLGCAISDCIADVAVCIADDVQCFPTTCPLDRCGVGICNETAYGIYSPVDNICNVIGDAGTCTENLCGLTCTFDEVCTEGEVALLRLQLADLTSEVEQTKSRVSVLETVVDALKNAICSVHISEGFSFCPEPCYSDDIPQTTNCGDNLYDCDGKKKRCIDGVCEKNQC